MASYSSKSYDPSPERERFQRTRGVAFTGSDRVASPSVVSSAGDSDNGDTGGEFDPIFIYLALSLRFRALLHGLTRSGRVVIA